MVCGRKQQRKTANHYRAIHDEKVFVYAIELKYKQDMPIYYTVREYALFQWSEIAVGRMRIFCNSGWLPCRLFGVVDMKDGGKEKLMSLAVQSNFLQTTDNKTQRFNRSMMDAKPNGCANVGLHERQDFINAFQKEIADMRTLGEYGLAGFLENNLGLYEKFGAADEAVIGQAENTKAYGKSRLEELAKRYGEDNPYTKALRGLEKSFDATFPNAPKDVKDAWIDMSIDSGMNEITGISLDGKHSHISQILVQKAVRDYHIQHGNYLYVEDGWGESIESMMNILKQAISDIDNPLQGEPAHSAEAQKLRENEENFYVEFLERMGWMMPGYNK